MRRFSYASYSAIALAVAALASVAGPALASGRGIQADDPRVSPVPVAGCTLGSACTGINLPGGTYGGYVNDDGSLIRFFADTKLFVYKEGVVSFGTALPSTASLASGTASLGSGNWFAPAFGAPTDVLTYDDGNGQLRINWGPHVGDILPGYVPPEPDPITGFVEPPPRIQALFQMVIFDRNFGFPPLDVFAVFNYDGGVVPGGRNVAYSYRPFDVDPLLTGPNPNDGRDDFFQLAYSGGFGAGPGDTGGVPEPAAWALMLLGFGAMGAVLRRARPRALTVA